MTTNDIKEEKLGGEEDPDFDLGAGFEVKLEPEYEDEFRNLENSISITEVQLNNTKPANEDVKVATGDGEKKKRNRDGEFFCTECDYFTKRNDKLKLHIKTKHQGLRFPCDVCNYAALRPDKLRDHKKNVHGLETVYECTDCDFQSSTFRALQLHQKTHPEKEHACEYCSYTTKRPMRLREHIERKHENGAYPCDSCDYIAPSNLSLTRHKDNKHNPMRYSCDQCDYQAKRPDTLLNHKKRKHEEAPEELEASIFGLNEDIDDDLIKEESPPNDVKVEKVPVPGQPAPHFLNESFGESEKLTESGTSELDGTDPSLWLLHQGFGEVKAEVEDFSDEDYSEMKYEPMYFMADDSGLVEDDDEDMDPNFKPSSGGSASKGGKKSTTPKEKKYSKKKLGHFTCDLCDYSSPRNDKVRLHVRTVHEGVRYPCDLCPYQATRPDKLKLHKVRKHFDPKPRKPRKLKYAGVKEHMCDKCDYKSAKMRNLQAHVVRNHSDSVFHCDQCDYVGTFRLNLKNHQERMHSGKMLMCEKCNYTTRDGNRLRYHNQSKHEDRKYPCDQCEYVGAIRCELKRHIRRKHGSEKYLCKLCDYIGKRIDHLRDHMKRIHEPKGSDGSGVKLISPDKKPGVDQLARSMQHYAGLDYSRSSDMSQFVDQKPVITPPGLLYQSHKSNNYAAYSSMLGGHSFLLDQLPRTAEQAGSSTDDALIRIEPSTSREHEDEPRNILLPKAESSIRSSYSELRDYHLNKIYQSTQRQSVIVSDSSAPAAAQSRDLVIQRTDQAYSQMERSEQVPRLNVIEKMATNSQTNQRSALNGVGAVKVEQAKYVQSDGVDQAELDQSRIFQSSYVGQM